MPRKLSNALTPLTVKNAKPGRHADGGGPYIALCLMAGPASVIGQRNALAMLMRSAKRRWPMR